MTLFSPIKPLLFFSLFLTSIFCFEKAPYRFTDISRFEDTVRIALVYNKPIGGWQFGYWCPIPGPRGIASKSCPDGTTNVGQKMLELTVAALDSNSIPNIVLVASDTLTWSSVTGWWPGKLPHVIVHLNGGWYSCNGLQVPSVLSKAAEMSVGIVAIGDDAAAFANNFFHFNNVKNVKAPQKGAARSNIDLWLDIPRSNDTLKQPGIIKNAVDKILSGNRINYKPYAKDGRCEADADVFEIDPSDLHMMTYLGYQRGKIGSKDISNPDGPGENYNAIIALEVDQRRAVVFSFQPQYLEEPVAVAQIIHDGIIWAAFAHTLRGKQASYTILR